MNSLLRRIRFWLLERVLLPVAIVPLRLLIRTWRGRGPDDTVLHAMMRTPRVVLVTYHGMFLHLLKFSQLPPAFGRRLVVMLSPSRDGQLLAAALQRFGITHVCGTSGSRGIAGSLEFIERIKAGNIGVVAADGPLGPCCVAKDGVLRIAAAAGAAVAPAMTSAGWGTRFGSWDRAHLPAPFARVELSLQLLPPPDAKGDAPALHALQQALISDARRLGSPVLPPELMLPDISQPATC
jgi:lysophospholipid acyltransferase (LPLAT)-like uncharacterized protein